MSVGTGPEGLRHRRRGLGRSLRSRTRIFLPRNPLFLHTFIFVSSHLCFDSSLLHCTVGRLPSSI